MRRVLVPVDGSQPSFDALDFALDVAARFDASVHVVHFSNQETDATEAIIERAREHVDASDLVDTPTVELVDLAVWTDSGVGKAIVQYAQEEEYDHIVMGHHGSGAVERAILGSAAEAVVRASALPVTVVP
jgi:nucleotide-binding universal stress UspA family protein